MGDILMPLMRWIHLSSVITLIGGVVFFVLRAFADKATGVKKELAQTA